MWSTTTTPLNTSTKLASVRVRYTRRCVGDRWVTPTDWSVVPGRSVRRVPRATEAPEELVQEKLPEEFHFQRGHCYFFSASEFNRRLLDGCPHEHLELRSCCVVSREDRSQVIVNTTPLYWSRSRTTLPVSYGQGRKLRPPPLPPPPCDLILLDLLVLLFILRSTPPPRIVKIRLNVLDYPSPGRGSGSSDCRLSKIRPCSVRPLTVFGPDTLGKETHRHFPHQFYFLKKSV